MDDYNEFYNEFVILMNLKMKIKEAGEIVNFLKIKKKNFSTFCVI